MFEPDPDDREKVSKNGGHENEDSRPEPTSSESTPVPGARHENGEKPAVNSGEFAPLPEHGSESDGEAETADAHRQPAVAYEDHEKASKLDKEGESFATLPEPATENSGETIETDTDSFLSDASHEDDATLDAAASHTAASYSEQTEVLAPAEESADEDTQPVSVEAISAGNSQDQKGNSQITTRVDEPADEDQQETMSEAAGDSQASLSPDGSPTPEEQESSSSASSLDGGKTLPSLADQDASQPPEDTQPVRVKPGTLPPPPPLGKTPPPPFPLPSRSYQIPLPRRVNEVDVDGTRVTPSAYSPTAKPRGDRLSTSVSRSTPGVSRSAPGVSPAQQRRYPGAPPRRVPPARRSIQAAPSSGWARTLGCLVRLAVLSLFGLVILVLCAGSILVYQYYAIASTLPNVADLRQKSSQFETTRILDRNGNVLYEILDPSAGRRTYVPLQKISPYMVAATIATEDNGFYSHPGFDVWAIFRAFLQNYQSGDTVSGASTITQQLARNLLFTPAERNERTYQRKIREAILAAEITRRYTKDEILELYLNENYYGNLSYGVEAAAETYFGTTADKLTLAQSAFLAGLPQAPSVYDVYTNRDQTLKRQQDVLVLMYTTSQEQGCIYVSNNPQRVCVDPVEASQAANELKNYEFRSPDIQMRYPHWVNYIRFLLESQYDAQTIYRSGFTVYTTLDPGLQDTAEQIVKDQVDKLAANHATDGALVAIRPNTGEILAMVGSADFNNAAISGQVNMALSPRQPGSSIKPLTYTAAFEKGWTPATLIWDVPTEFTPSGKPDDPSPPYKPVNYDGRFHGPVTVRTALANSLNIPAVKTLNFIGIYDDPANPGQGGFINFAKRMGITTLNRPDYGLSLTLGGGDVSLLELTGAYAIYANSGRRVPPVAITRILDHAGNTVYQYQPPPGDQVVRPEHAYLISSILSDNQARTPEFGGDSVLNLPFPAAAKTGTTNDFRDNWTLGYTPDVAVGVWVGNADFTPMQDTTGLTGAAPIWSEFMKRAVQALTGDKPTPFIVPGGVVEYVICEVSGTQPSEWCPKQRGEVFAADQPPLPKDQDLWQKVTIDTWTALRASPACSGFTADQFVLNVIDPAARKWIKKDPDGQSWAKEMGFEDPVTFTPERECKAEDPRPKLEITSPHEKDTIIDNPLDIYGAADATQNFDYFELDYGIGEDPVEWQVLEKRKSPMSQPEKITSWDLEDIPAGPVTLRLYMHSTLDTFAETKLLLNAQVPTPTPTPTETPTPTYTPTPTFTATSTEMPTSTPTNTPLPTDTPQPSDTPQPTAAPPQEVVATETNTPFGPSP